MKNEKMLELVLKKKWFDLIESGEKKEEYRDLKLYWWKRILSNEHHVYIPIESAPAGTYNAKHHLVRFRLGYSRWAKQMTWSIGRISIGYAKPEWAEGYMEKVIVIELQKRIS